MTTPTIPFYPVTHDDGTNIVEALNNLVSAKRMPYVVADGFSTSVSYNVNDYVIHENNLYRFTAPHTAGSWNSSQAIRVTIGEELNTLNIEKVNNDVIAPIFTTNNNYNVNDVVLYNGNLYRFISEHTAGVWNETEVIQTNAISEGGGGGTGVGDEITFDGDNMIITSSERSIESLESSIAIVANGDTHITISSGQYVYVKNHTTLTEGLYTTNSAIGENVALTSSNLTKITIGGLNKLKDKVESYKIIHVPRTATGLAMYSGTITVGIPFQGDYNYASISPNTCNLSIFGNKGVGGTTATVSCGIDSNRSLTISFNPNTALSNYSDYGKALAIEIGSSLTITLS